MWSINISFFDEYGATPTSYRILFSNSSLLLVTISKGYFVFQSCSVFLLPAELVVQEAVELIHRVVYGISC